MIIIADRNGGEPYQIVMTMIPLFILEQKKYATMVSTVIVMD